MLDYLATHPDAVMIFRAFDMILDLRSDVFYLSEKNAKSRIGSYFFLGYIPKKGKGAFYKGRYSCLCGILKLCSVGVLGG